MHTETTLIIVLIKYILKLSNYILAPNVCNFVHCDFICTSGSKGPMCVCEDGSQVEPGIICNVILYFIILCIK